VAIIESFGSWIGLIFVLAFVGLMIFFTIFGRKQPAPLLREIAAFTRLKRAVGLSVEAGTRLHISVGHGGLTGMPSSSALIGLHVLERVTRAASISDRPPVATAGEGALSILCKDALNSAYRAAGTEGQYDFHAGRLTGVTPFSYTAGAMTVIQDEHVSANVLAGHFGSEVALLTEASERKGSLTLAGSESLPAQAVLYAAAEEPLVGEELFASGAYLGSGVVHAASLQTQDLFRWILVVLILLGAIARLVGSLL